LLLLLKLLLSQTPFQRLLRCRLALLKFKLVVTIQLGSDLLRNALVVLDHLSSAVLIC